MPRLPQSATLEGPSDVTGNYTVKKTKNTLEIKPGQKLSEKEVEKIIRASRIDLTITAFKK